MPVGEARPDERQNSRRFRMAGEGNPAIRRGGVSSEAQPLRQNESRRRTLVVRIDDSRFAIPVDEVRAIEEVSDASVVPCHSARLAYCATEVELDGIRMPVLDLREVVQGALNELEC